MSLLMQRVFYDGTDISVEVNDYRAQTKAVTYTGGEYIHIASQTPFNNLWFEFTIGEDANTPGDPVVQVWYDGAWVNAVDVIDGTSAMNSSGRISWALPLDRGWQRERLSTDVGLASTDVYDRYWCRLSWPSDFTATLAYIGQKFSSDTAMQSIYPDLLRTNILTGFKAGKTNWDEQHFLASDAILREIKSRNFAHDRGQIFDWSVFEIASCHYVASIVYQAFGLPYVEHAKNARLAFGEELNKKCFNIDTNADGYLSDFERNDRQGWITR